MAKHILDLSTFIDRPEVRIDGQLFQLYNRDELSVIDVTVLDRWMQEMDALEKKADPTEEDAKTHLAIARKYVGKVVIDLPAEVIAKVNADVAQAIVIHFYGLPQRVPTPEATRTQAHQSRKSTGGKRSRG